MNTAQAIAEILRREGVEQVFCFPFTPILDALAAAGIRPIVARQERVAENMADGFSRATDGRRLGVVTVQQSAGAENAFSGIAQAYTDSSPVLFLPGHPGSTLVGTAPTFDAVTNYRATTKWADLLPSADAVAGRMRRAFTALRSGRPRPVLLEVPLDVASSDLSGELDYRPVDPVRTGVDPAAIAAAADRLADADRPMIWAGQGVLWARASQELTELAELLGAPVMTTLLGKSGFDERHPLSVGAGGYSMTAMAAEALQESDVLFAVGASLVRDFTAPPIPAGKTIVHSTIDPSDFHVHYPARVTVLGDARLVLRDLVAELRRRGLRRGERRASVEKKVAAGKAAWRKRWRPLLESRATPIDPYRVIGDFMAAFDPDETIVTHESGSSRDMLVPLYEATTPRGYLGWGRSTQLGFSLGAAMGAKVARPEKTVVNFMGDAAFGMVGLDLETAVRERIPILTVLLNNSAMANYEQYIPISVERYGTKKLSGRYAEVATALGAHAERIERPDELRPAFERARETLDRGQPVLLEVISAEQPDVPYWRTFGLR